MPRQRAPPDFPSEDQAHPEINSLGTYTLGSPNVASWELPYKSRDLTEKLHLQMVGIVHCHMFDYRRVAYNLV